MTTAVFARAGRMADQVRVEVRRLDPAKALRTVLLLVPFLLGWIVGALGWGVWAVSAGDDVGGACGGFRAAPGGGREDEPG